jgi:hypothetical protein
VIGEAVEGMDAVRQGKKVREQPGNFAKLSL